jgi:hypothetical protein
MNKHLKYAKNATKKSFVDAANPFTGDNAAESISKKQYLYNTANNCRWWYSPIWANETQYLPNDDRANVEVEDNVKSDASALTVPPDKKNNLLLQAAIIGAGTFLALKILT